MADPGVGGSRHSAVESILGGCALLTGEIKVSAQPASRIKHDDQTNASIETMCVSGMLPVRFIINAQKLTMLFILFERI